ncbi:MAG: hypothetical protein IJ453_02160 [Oscillospiraceae bacterium]|nr:hypothetical protein [Oscillospiraceae bacterium]
MKRTFYTEAAYFIGLLLLAIGTAFMERAAFGMSMIVAPAYVVYLKISEYLPFFTFGMAEYAVQAVVLVILSLCCRRFRLRYLFSFVTAVVYGFLLDGSMALLALISGDHMALRVVFYLGGMVICAFGVAMLFDTYIPPEAYELFSKELSSRYGWKISRVKTVYDCASCALAVGLSLLLFGRLEGVYWGTIFCALVNGWLIGRAAALLNRCFSYRDGVPKLKRFFEKI